MRLAKDLLGGTSELLRLLARTNHLKLTCWDLVRVQLFAVDLSHLHHYAFEMAHQPWFGGPVKEIKSKLFSAFFVFVFVLVFGGGGTINVGMFKLFLFVVCCLVFVLHVSFIVFDYY